MADTARSSNLTVDHGQIRRWAEERGGRPARVKDAPAALHLDFPGHPVDLALERVAWDEWFVAFDAANLALLFQEVTRDGTKSTFHKLVARERLREQDQRDQGGAD
jgi:hypothetical protein